jgi:preprotein translocase subunit SecF
MLNLLGKRYFFFVLSLVLIVPGLLLAFFGLPLSIDFTGGSMLEVRFESGTAPLPAEVVLLYQEMGFSDTLVQSSSDNIIIARSAFLDDDSRSELISNMESKFGSEVTVMRFDTVGPTVGQEVASRALIAVAIAALAVILYITYAFRGITNAFRYGICAIIAMIHDVALVVSLGVLGGIFLGWQIDALFLTALLTVIGFSVQDKIVVFDRIRENARIYKRLPFETLVNHSIIQTLQRSINTQLMTVEFMLLALVLFGGVTLREFALILLVGLFSGTYSSIFIAAPLLVVWENQEWSTWFRRKKQPAVAG